MTKNSILGRDLKRILKNNLKRILWIAVITGFLFYLFNIFFSLSMKFNDLNSIITDKIGIYFYIDDTSNDDEIYKRIINIKDQLAQNDINANFSSKNDAFVFLENKIPEITKNFDKFGIDNPLPSTLYVMFDSEKKYNIMKDIIIENKDIILNIKDINKGATLQEQENRSLKILRIIKIIKNSIYFILAILSIILVSFTQHLLKTFFVDFHKELEIKKLLGATNKDTNGGFILTLLFIITIGFIIGLGLIYFTFCLLNHNLLTLEVNLSLCNIIPKLLIVYVIFGLITTMLGYNRLKILEKKL